MNDRNKKMLTLLTIIFLIFLAGGIAGFLPMVGIWIATVTWALVVAVNTYRDRDTLFDNNGFDDWTATIFAIVMLYGLFVVPMWIVHFLIR